MRIRAILLASLLPFVTALTAPAQLQGRIPAVLAEFDRLAAKPLWPGFEPGATPLEIFDGASTWLVRHPHPPAEFVPVPGRADTRVFEGRHASLRANTAVEIAGVMTAAASFEGRTESPRALAALLLHEAFHVFQARRHPKWGGNEAELFVYPVEDAGALALRRIESRSLARALEARDSPVSAGWASRALEARRARFTRLPAGASEYERGTELKEGLARYIEALALAESGSPFPGAEFPADRVRDRAYASGSAIALLLDRLDSRWKGALERGDESLEEILRRAVESAPAAVFPPEEETAIRRGAVADVAAWTDSRASLRREFLAAPGWTLIVESAAPLFPQGFDPLNVERLSTDSILHTRWIKLSNAEGTVEVLERRCLTEAAGKHPLFEGVKRATVAGLPEEPRPETSEGSVRVTAPGVTLAFRNARVSRSGNMVTITVAAPGSAVRRERID